MRRLMVGLSRPNKVAIMVATDAILLLLALWLALSLRYGYLWYVPDIRNLVSIGAALVSGLVALQVFGLYRWMVRYVSSQTVGAIARAMCASALVLGCAVMFMRAELPRSFPILYAIIGGVLLSGARWVAQYYLRGNVRRSRMPVVIYGAGNSGLQLGQAMQLSLEYRVVAYVDDNPALQGMMIYGIRVHSPEHLGALVEDFGVRQILLAMPSISISQRRDILLKLDAFSIKVRTVPGMADIVSGRARVDQIRDVEVEDLLGRDPVPPREDLLGATITGKVVMVTGAGGSIGSELCRQIIRLGPVRLVLVEISEFALYSIEAELKALGSSVELVPLLGSVQREEFLMFAMRGFEVQTVFHAAAYKHVPLVEYNVIEAVRNNVFGTLAAVDAACAAGVETFVLISTDKAVRPTNIMGASKRLAELILQAKAAAGASTRLCMVRFGNVLGSSGSVVPLFKAQIAAGGPVTVTHPEIIRYFMTIPEAALLVIQAAAMAKGGDVFLLDMGEPVKIADLARRMIHLMGYHERTPEQPQGDIEIVYSGLRPGEKLFEELLICDAPKVTEHPRIMRGEEVSMAWVRLCSELDRLVAHCGEGNASAIHDQFRSLPLGFLGGGEHDLLGRCAGLPSVVGMRRRVLN